MKTRMATCRCGQLSAHCQGEPVRVSVCHCLDCQKRTGSVFGTQARWPEDAVKIVGADKSWQKTADSGRWGQYHFCPNCGTDVFYRNELFPGQIAIPVGAFADSDFPAPRFSVYSDRAHAWVEIRGDVARSTSPNAPGSSEWNARLDDV